MKLPSIVGVNAPDLPQAACREVDEPDTWFPFGYGATDRARAICSLCPERVPCLQYAIANGELWGIWGGMTGEQRRQLIRGAS